MKSPTLHDVARLAGVSYATADRVVNRRGNVAEKSVRKVEDAVEQIGYIRNIAAANLSRSRVYRLAFVLPRRKNDFFGRIHHQLERTAEHLKTSRVEIEVVEYETFSQTAFEEALTGLAGSKFDGIAVVGLKNKALSKPLEELRKSGVKIVSLVSDLPEQHRDHYIGIDNTKAGKSAARLVGMAHTGRAGRVIVMVGSLQARDHLDRFHGFKEVIINDYPNLEIDDVLETKDDPKVLREQLQERLAANDAVTALYNVGAGNQGLIDALRMTDRSESTFSVVHELTGDTRQALEDRVVDVAIDQRPEIELNRALALLRAIVDNLPPPPVTELIPAIYLRDNLPDET